MPHLFSSKAHAIAADSWLDERTLLKDLSFQLFTGDRVALIGASGAGKTLFLRLLNRLSEPTRGTLYLNDQPFQAIPVLQLRQQIGFVSQEPKLLGMKVQQALEYPLTLRKLPQAAIAAQVREWAERLHVPREWLDRTELQLSVGQRQLVAIARALVAQPQILLLDEPTSALDVGRSQHVLNVLAELTEHQPLTVIMASHQLELIEPFCNRVLQLDAGHIVDDRPAHQLDWSRLRQSLIAAEVRQAQEWGS